MKPYYIYIIYTSVLAVTLIAIVPKKDIKKLGFYGILFGGLGDVLAILILFHILNLGSYINYKSFGFKGLPFFPPIAWSIWFILYFYFLPEQKTLKYIYITLAAAYSVLFSNVLVNLKILKWNQNKTILPFIIYITWFSAATWIKRQID